MSNAYFLLNVLSAPKIALLYGNSQVTHFSMTLKTLSLFVVLERAHPLFSTMMALTSDQMLCINCPCLVGHFNLALEQSPGHLVYSQKQV